MLLGVVSDTHNNIKNVRKIIDLFNKERVNIVIHTGDITNTRTLECFAELDAPLYGVFGNNDRNEKGLGEACIKHNFIFKEPPLTIELNKRKIAIFHEPDLIEEYTRNNQGVDLVLHGHTHRYKEEKVDNTIHFNPGESAGNMSGKNALGIINLKNLEIKRIFF